MRMEDVLTPSECAKKYSDIWAMPEFGSVERARCLHPSDRLCSRQTPCLPSDQRLAPTCCATLAVFGLFSAVPKLLHMVRRLPISSKTFSYCPWPARKIQ
jgi:hypothetical protein